MKPDLSELKLILNGNSQSQNVLDRYAENTKKLWIQALAIILCKAFNHL